MHFSVAHLDWYGKNPDDYISKMKCKDKDLAEHFTNINHRGMCLCGVPIKDAFAEAPVQDYMFNDSDNLNGNRNADYNWLGTSVEEVLEIDLKFLTSLEK